MQNEMRVGSFAVSRVAQCVIDLLGYPSFGSEYPKKYELIWANPKGVSSRIKHQNLFIGRHPQRRKTVVCFGDWDQQTQGISENSLSTIERMKYLSLKARILNARSWESTETFSERLDALKTKGVIDDGIDSPEALMRRFAKLDEIIVSVKAYGRLKTRQELKASNFREKGGVPILVGRDGTLILGRNGTHRFFICHILGVPLMPFSLIAVHPEAKGYFLEVRRKSDELASRFGI